MQYRIRVEVEYFIALCGVLPELKHFPKEKFNTLRSMYTHFDEAAAEKIKTIEKTTGHDVKAVEYLIKEKFDKLGLTEFKEFIHFGLTSQDVNNTATPLLLKEFMDTELVPALQTLLKKMEQQVSQWSGVAMLARTHGQPASPTRLGKEMAVFVERVNRQLELLKHIPHSAKFGLWQDDHVAADRWAAQADLRRGQGRRPGRA